MRISLTRTTVLVVTMLLAFPAFAAKGGNGGGKPGGDPPPPPPAGNECAGDEFGAFPAAAFTRHILGGRRGREEVGTTIFLANAKGDCSIPIYASSGGRINPIAYVQSGDSGRIIWAQNHKDDIGRKEPRLPVIKMVDFTVVNKEVALDPPLAATTVTTFQAASIHGLVLSADQNTIFYATEESDPIGWLDKLNSIDISTCTSDCTPVVHMEFQNEGVGSVALNPAGDRVYMSSHDRVNDVNSIFFAEIQSGGVLSPLKDVVTDTDNPYLGAGFPEIHVAAWDADNDGDSEEVMAFSYSFDGPRTTDIVDLSNCPVAGTGSCMANGDISILRSGIEGGGWFTLFPTDPSDLAPNLLMITNEGDIVDFDLDSMTPSPTFFTEPADPANL